MTKKEMKKILKPMFINYEYLKPQNRKKFRKIGFTVDYSKYNKLLYDLGNGKTLSFTVSVTSSDRKAGLNLVSDIVNTINNTIKTA